MAPPVRTPRSAWIAAALEALADGGPQAVRVDVLARRLGVTRGGFYGQFKGRDELLEAVLDEWERRSVDAVLGEAGATDREPRAKAIRAGLLTFSPELVRVDLAVRDWARRDAKVSARLRRVDTRRMDYLRSLVAASLPNAGADEVAARSLLAFGMALADQVLAADLDGVDVTLVRRLAVRHLFDELSD